MSQPQTLGAARALDRGAIIELLQATLASAPMVLFVVDRAGTFQLSVGAGLASLGLEQNQIVGLTHQDVYGHLEQAVAALEGALAGRTSSFEVEERGVAWDVRYAPLRDPYGAVTGAVGTAIDVTARRRAEDAGRLNEQRYRALFDNMQSAFLLFEVLLDERGEPHDHRLVEANAEFDRHTGLDRRAEIGRTSAELGFQWPEPVRRAYYDLAMNGGSMHTERYNESLQRHYEVRAFQFAHGQWAVLLDDITERKRREGEREGLRAELAQAQKLESIGRLAGGVAHDFNNMLAVILGHAELAIEAAAFDAGLSEGLHEIRAAAERSARLTRQLLAFARRQPVVARVIDLNAAVGEAITMLRRLIGENITLRFTPAAELPLVRVDAGQIDQILVNLCVNARDAIAGVGTVTIETRAEHVDESFCRAHPGVQPGLHAAIVVRDTGRGMDADALAHAFEPFYTTKPLGQGTGLGLATVYGVAAQHGGCVTVDSVLGEGTSFVIRLPAHRGDAAHAAPRTASPIPAGKGTILFVEDEPALLRLGVSALGQLGYSVLAAATPREALTLAASRPGPIDLVVTDVIMPEMNGRELVEQLRRARPGVPCLYTSGYTADVMAEAGAALDDRTFLPKPWTRRELAARVRDLLEGGGPARA